VGQSESRSETEGPTRRNRRAGGATRPPSTPPLAHRRRSTSRRGHDYGPKSATILLTLSVKVGGDGRTLTPRPRDSVHESTAGESQRRDEPLNAEARRSVSEANTNLVVRVFPPRRARLRLSPAQPPSEDLQNLLFVPSPGGYASIGVAGLVIELDETPPLAVQFKGATGVDPSPRQPLRGERGAGCRLVEGQKPPRWRTSLHEAPSRRRRGEDRWHGPPLHSPTRNPLLLPLLESTPSVGHFRRT